MLLNKLFTNRDELVEMANLGSKATNVSGGYIWISTRQGSHGCRIKFFTDLRFQNKLVTIYFPELVIVDDTLGKEIDNKKRKEIVQFGKTFTKELLDFWNQGNKWDDDKVTQFKSTLKLTNENLRDSANIILKWK